LINVSDIDVAAKNVKTSVMSTAVKTNPQGYFRTGTLPPGEYQICVSGPGYASVCDPQRITIVNSIRVMDHVVEIRPAQGALSGTVRLADQVTPCFWFRPAFSTDAVLTAKVSLLDTADNVVAGPVNGNSLGQFVLPVSANQAGGVKLKAVCEGSSSVLAVKFSGGMQQRDLVIRDSPPQIVSFDLTKGGVGVRRANPGDTLNATVVANDPLHYQWVDDSGRALGLPDSPSVNWTLLNAKTLNTLRVQVSDGRGGFAVSQKSLRAGPDEILFEGTLLDRQTNAPVGNAQVSLNGTTVKSNAKGVFEVSVPDAPRFVLNISKPGFAFVSRVYYGRNTGLHIPLDATQKATVNGKTGGPVVMPTEGCACACGKNDDKGDDYGRRQPDEDRDKDKRHQWWDRGDDDRKRCKTKGQLALRFESNSLVDAHGNPFTGTATVEMFQYDTSLPNPIPGDQGAVSQGKTVRLSTFGAFYIQARDSAGNPPQVAPSKKVNVTMPIEAALLAKAPGTVPFFRYEETTGLWTEIGTLTRSGNNYLGSVNHFSVFNADTFFPGGACVKVILDPSFTLPVALDASYVDPSSGTFNHNGTQATDSTVGIERMTPNVSFTLEVHEGNTNALLKSVTLNSGPGLDPVQFPGGLDTDTVNFSHCNGPVTVYNNNVPTGPTFIMPVTGGAIQDNSAAYQTATDANPGGTRDTLPHWLSVNGFTGSGESTAIYFNNGDLKFGRNMHCRVTNLATGAAACYVQNFGNVGTDDSATALSDARSAATPVATVTMEYDPTAPNGENVQFWAYKGDGSYLPRPTLDGQGAKPNLELCLACHGGSYSGTGKAAGAVFLPFDLDSFIYDSLGDPHTQAPVQEQFRQLNNLVLNTHPDTLTGNGNQPFTHLMSIWYPSGVGTGGSTFAFSTGAAQLGGFTGNEPLYDNVVKVTCRTCHLTRSSFDDWTSFSQMNGSKTTIRLYACGGGSPAAHSTVNFAMPHGEVPFKNFWLNSLSSTLDSELSLGGCPNQ
jgi:hypothetical protein